METTKLIDIVTGKLDTKEIRENIIVKCSNQYEYGTHIIAQFQSKKDMLNEYFPNGTYFNMTEGYFAEFILKGLRIQEEKELSLFLMCLFSHELCLRIRGNIRIRLREYENQLKEYIQNKWKIHLGGRGCDTGLYADFFFLEALYVYEEDEEKLIEELCKYCKTFWSAFFLTNGIGTYFSSFTCYDNRYYSEKWNHYILFNGEPVVYDEETKCYKKISLIIAEHKFPDLEKENIIFFIDGNIYNFSKDNIGRFQNEKQYIRWKHGDAEIDIDPNGNVEMESFITKHEFKKMYRIYSEEKLKNIYGLNKRQIDELKMKYELPNKSIIKTMSDEEYDKL